MRAVFNSSVDLHRGEGSAAPRELWAFGDCRFVAENYEIPVITPLSSRVAYVTLEAAQPNEPTVTGSDPSLTTNYAKADVLAIPAGSAPRYRVLFVERVTYSPQPPYWRAHIQPFAPTQKTGQTSCAVITGDIYQNLLTSRSGASPANFSWSSYNLLAGREYSLQVISCTDANCGVRAKVGATCAGLTDSIVQIGVGQSAWVVPATGAVHAVRWGREAGAGAWAMTTILWSRPL